MAFPTVAPDINPSDRLVVGHLSRGGYPFTLSARAAGGLKKIETINHGLAVRGFAVLLVLLSAVLLVHLDWFYGVVAMLCVRGLENMGCLRVFLAALFLFTWWASGGFMAGIRLKNKCAGRDCRQACLASRCQCRVAVGEASRVVGGGSGRCAVGVAGQWARCLLYFYCASV